MTMATDGGQKTLNLILKADGQGAVEALRARVESLSNAEVDIRVIYAGVGGMTPNDVQPRERVERRVDRLQPPSRRNGQAARGNEQSTFASIKSSTTSKNDLKKAMLGMLTPKFREVTLGRAEVREVFKVSKVGTIAGCYVQSEKITRNAKVRVLRDAASSSKATSNRCDASRTTFAKSPRTRVRHPDLEVPGPQGRRRDRGLHVGARRGRTVPA